MEGHYYLVGNGIIKAANRKYTDQDFTITFDKMAIFVDVTPANAVI